MLLATLSDLKEFLGKDTDGMDPLLTTLLTRVSKRVETWLNRELDKKARTKLYDAGRRLYYLPAYPIDLNSPVTVLWQDQLQTLSSDYWIWDDIGMIELYTRYDRIQPREMSFTWTGGWVGVSTDVPDDVQLGVIIQTAFLFRRRKDIGVSSFSLPDGSMTVNTPLKLLPDVIDILRPHRRVPGMN